MSDDKIHIDPTNHLPKPMAAHCRLIAELAIEDQEFHRSVEEALDGFCGYSLDLGDSCPALGSIF